MGNRIRDLRVAAGWSQQDLGEQVGRSWQAICAYETERRTPPKRILAQIEAATLKATAKRLVELAQALERSI